MKSVLKVLLIILFAASTSLLVIALSLQKANYSANSIKTRLNSANFYQKVFDEVDKSLKSSANQESGPDPLAPILGQFLNKEYLQQKIELFIDDTQTWAIGKAKKPPVLSFVDIKEKLIAQNPDLVKTLQEANAEFAKQQKETFQQSSEQVQQQAAQAGEATTDTQQQNINFNQIMKSDFSIPIGQNILFVKNLSWLVQNILIFEILPLIFLVAIILLSSSLKSKLKWLSAAFLITAILNGIAFLAVNGLSGLLAANFDKIFKFLPSFAASLFEVLVKPFLASYPYFVKIAIGMSVFGFIVSLISSMVIKENIKTTKL